jgi:inorganic pyrophosphatase
MSTTSRIEPAEQVEVVIEIPRGSFLKRDLAGKIDYVSPFPCPFNYGSVDAYIGLDGDLLDAVVLGRRLRSGTRTRIAAIGAIRITDRGRIDDKLICSDKPVGSKKRACVLLFFKFYVVCKGLLNFFRGHSGHNRCRGWISAKEAIENATARENRS